MESKAADTNHQDPTTIWSGRTLDCGKYGLGSHHAGHSAQICVFEDGHWHQWHRLQNLKSRSLHLSFYILPHTHPASHLPPPSRYFRLQQCTSVVDSVSALLHHGTEPPFWLGLHKEVCQQRLPSKPFTDAQDHVFAPPQAYHAAFSFFSYAVPLLPSELGVYLFYISAGHSPCQFPPLGLWTWSTLCLQFLSCIWLLFQKQ